MRNKKRIIKKINSLNNMETLLKKWLKNPTNEAEKERIEVLLPLIQKYRNWNNHELEIEEQIEYWGEEEFYRNDGLWKSYRFFDDE